MIELSLTTQRSQRKQATNMKDFQGIKLDAVNKFYRCFIKYSGNKSHRKELADCKTTDSAIYRYAKTEKGKQDLQTIVDNIMNKYVDAQTIINEYIVNEATMYTATFEEVYDLFCADIVESTARAQKVYEDFDKWYDHFHKKDSDWVVWATTILIMLLTSAAVIFK